MKSDPYVVVTRDGDVGQVWSWSERHVLVSTLRHADGSFASAGWDISIPPSRVQLVMSEHDLAVIETKEQNNGTVEG
jgi:hypothetical protein